MKSIVLFVEGEGDVDAVPILVKRLLSEQNAWDAVRLDPDAYRVGGIQDLAKAEFVEWKRVLAIAGKRRNLGGILLLLDGDAKKLMGEDFCAAKIAKALANEAKDVGGGAIFSVAVVFARQEFESWLIAGYESLKGKRLSDGGKIDEHATTPDGDLETSPRDAKGWLRKVVEGGYKPTDHQAELTELVDLGAIRARQPRSFKRLESALSELIAAIRDDAHVVTPS